MTERSNCLVSKPSQTETVFPIREQQQTSVLLNPVCGKQTLTVRTSKTNHTKCPHNIFHSQFQPTTRLIEQIMSIYLAQSST